SQFDRLAALQPYGVNLNRTDEKAIVHLTAGFAPQLRHAMALAAIATPRFAGLPETSFGPAPPLALQRAAAFTTLSQLPHAGRSTQEFIDRMVATLPGFELRLGTDLDRIPVAIRELLRQGPDTLRALAARESPMAAGGPRPLVSVIIPVHNGNTFLADAIRSVLAQEYPSLEIIVVDDGSSEDVETALRETGADVRLLRQENAGAAAARNRGIRDASGDVIAFLDVDDLWPAGALASLVDALAGHPDADVVRGRAQVTRFAGPGVPGEYLGSPAEAFPYYIGAGVYRRRAFETIGLFDPRLRFGEDTDWYTRAREGGLRIEQVDEVTLFVRRHEGNMTRGKSLAELNPLRLFKNVLDRRRAGGP
ncbi:MAG TPA: glycosyltransferase family A protein, partial [Gemmatimonadaceae bacterium]|nr:glycosyltransferase family A protein [Gemmatimonadaceae bacterium]